MEELKRILRMKKSDKQKIELVAEVLYRDTSKNYWINNLVSVREDEIEKIITKYGKEVLDFYIQQLDSYLYKTGKKYVSHYLTMLNWIRNDPSVKEIPVQTHYKCSYGIEHKMWEKCNCY